MVLVGIFKIHTILTLSFVPLIASFIFACLIYINPATKSGLLKKNNPL